MITLDSQGMIYINDIKTEIQAYTVITREYREPWEYDIRESLSELCNRYGYICNRLDELILIKYAKSGKIPINYISMVWKARQKGIIK